MSKVTLNYPVVGQKDSTEEPKVTTALKAIEEFINGAKIESTDNIKAGGIAEVSLSAAVQSLLNTKSAAALSLVEKNEAAFTAASGELVAMVKDASVLTLPEPTVNRIVGVFCGVAITSITVKCTKAATRIYGDFLGEAGANEVTLTKGQHVLVQASGASWVLLAGEPKRTQTYSALAAYTSEKEEEASATRLAQVTLAASAGNIQSVTVGGVALGPSVAGGTTFVSFLCPPGVKWKAKTSSTSEYSYLLL